MKGDVSPNILGVRKLSVLLPLTEDRVILSSFVWILESDLISETDTMVTDCMHDTLQKTDSSFLVPDY